MSLALLAVQTSFYQLFKLWLVPYVGLTKDAIHIYVGFACLLVSVLVLRAPLSSWRALVLGILAAVVMETLDLRDDLAAFGYLRWWASVKDMLNTNAIPILLVLLAKAGWIPGQHRRGDPVEE
jgi:hypothetical protein